MALSTFLRSLFDNGHVRLPAYAPLATSQLGEADGELIAFERLTRLDTAGEAPEFNIEAARWAAVIVFRACQFTVHRDVPAEIVAHDLGIPCPSPRQPSTDYSADLTLRFLPDLLTFARSAAENDPLVASLRRLAQEWPLSSVGVADLVPLDLSSFFDHPALRTLYVDRVLARGDAARLDNLRVKQAVEAAVGAHRELAGKLAALLSPPPNVETPEWTKPV
jgi:hypothetical protein